MRRKILIVENLAVTLNESFWLSEKNYKRTSDYLEVLTDSL